MLRPPGAVQCKGVRSAAMTVTGAISTPVGQQDQEVCDPHLPVEIQVGLTAFRVARAPGSQQIQEISDPDPAVAVDVTFDITNAEQIRRAFPAA